MRELSIVLCLVSIFISLSLLKEPLDRIADSLEVIASAQPQALNPGDTP